MEEISVVVIEDEKLLAKSLKLSLIEKGYEVKAVVDNAKDGLKTILAEKPDIVLLDIQLKGNEDGIWLASQLKDKYDAPYIFMTSFNDKETINQAVKTFPYGYMIKPVDEAELDANISLALERFQQEKQNRNEPQFIINDAVFLKDEHFFIKLKFNEILFVQASGNYIEIMEENKKHVVKTTLKSFLSSVPSDQFLQCHRSYVVNLEKIDKIGSRSLFINNIEIPMVKENREELLNRLQYFAK